MSDIYDLDSDFPEMPYYGEGQGDRGDVDDGSDPLGLSDAEAILGEWDQQEAEHLLGEAGQSVAPPDATRRVMDGREVSPLGDRGSTVLQRIEDSLDMTWWLFDSEPGMDDIYDRAGDSLETLTDQMGYQIFQTNDGNPRLFQCRFEFLREGGTFKYDGRDSSFAGDIKVYLDFLTGFPIDCIEIMFMVAQYSSLYTHEQITKMDYGNGATPPVPASFFEGYDPDRIMVNITAIDREMSGGQYYGVHLVKGLSGASEPENIKWFARTNLGAEEKWPIPGEFVALGVRIMPTDIGGNQQTSPFLYAGNWIDSVYYTSGEIEEVDDSGETPIYTVKWRNQRIRIPSTDYAKYSVGDRVTILKDVETRKLSQTWEDADSLEPQSGVWSIAPIMFYGIEYGE